MADEQDVIDEALDEEVDVNIDDVDIDDVDIDEEPDESLEDKPEGDEKPDDAKPDKPEVTVESLSARLEEAEKEKSGLYREMRTEREQRQALSTQMAAINETLADIRNKRVSTAKDPEEAPEIVNGIPVQFDDDGNPYINPEDLKAVATPEVSTIKADMDQIKRQGARQELINANKQTISHVVGQEEQYGDAFQTLRKAYQDVADYTVKIMAQQGWTVQTANEDQVFDLLEKEFGTEFTGKYPGVDLDTVIEALSPGRNGLLNRRKLTRAVKNIARSSGKESRDEGKESLKKLKFMSSKPSNLSGTRNQKGSAGRTLKDVAEMDIDEFENLSDTDLKRIERAMGGLDV